MINVKKNYIFNKYIDFHFIKFPIILPLIYAFFLYQFPNFENYLIMITIILLAEPHFGATWKILFYEKNYAYINQNKNIFFFGSGLVVFLSLFGFFYYKSLFFLIFYGFNVFHVTRQSIGISKFYNNNKSENNFQLFIIYFFNLIFFLVGLFRFYAPIIDLPESKFLSFVFLFLIILIFFLQFLKYKSLDNSLITITGIIIFYPILFVESPVHAILFGVTMHYSQYLLITSKVYLGRKNNANEFYNNMSSLNLVKIKFLIYLFFYGLIMGFLTLFNKSTSLDLKDLIIIPILGQMLHFYLDGYLWKFSEPHNRNVTLIHLR